MTPIPISLLHRTSPYNNESGPQPRFLLLTPEALPRLPRMNHGRLLTLALSLVTALTVFAQTETPGEFQPQPVLHPAEKVGANGFKGPAPGALPKSRAELEEPHRKPKQANRLAPEIRGNELILNGGWELAAVPDNTPTGGVLSEPVVNSKTWYDATVPGTVLATLVDQGVYPDPYYGLNNTAIPESLNEQDYWYRTEFNVPPSMLGRQVWLNFEGINYYAEVWLNGQYLGHITGAFMRGKFNVSGLVDGKGANVLAVKITPPPDPGIPSEQSVKYGPGDNGGTTRLDGPTFVCSEGWDWIPAIRDRDAGIWQDVVLEATGPVIITDPRVITDIPLPDTNEAAVSLEVQLSNVSKTDQSGTLKGSFEGVSFEGAVSLRAGESRKFRFTPADFPQLTVEHPRLWWPNGYGKPELYHLKLSYVDKSGIESDTKALHFGIRQMSYLLEVKMPDGSKRRVEYTPSMDRTGRAVLDNSRKALGWRVKGSKEGPCDPEVIRGREASDALKYVDDPSMDRFLGIEVNGQRIMCYGGNWGMDDAMKRISRAKLGLTSGSIATPILSWFGIGAGRAPRKLFTICATNTASSSGTIFGWTPKVGTTCQSITTFSCATSPTPSNASAITHPSPSGAP